MKFLMTTALLSVLAMGAVEARPMMHGSMGGEPAQNFYYYFGQGCNTTYASSCDPCTRGTMDGDVVSEAFGGPVRMVRGVGGMFY